MSGRLNGKVALVTGGAAGIGQAYAQRLAGDGARVVIADLADAHETLGLVEAAGSSGLGITCDISSPEAVAGLAKQAEADVGPIDILVHNAGIYPLQPFHEITFDDWRRVQAVNLDSTFLLCQAFLPGMRSRGWGRIVCIASNTFHAGIPNMAHYVASKGGIIGLVRALPAEFGDEGVTINAIAPSLVRSKGTSQGPHDELGLFDMVAGGQAIKRTQTPEDLVGALSFLVSDEAAFITGQTLLVDGGLARA